MNRNELVESILKDVDRVEDEDALEDDAQAYRRPRPPKEPSQVYSVRIPVDRLEELRRVAEERQMTPSALLREWVVKGLDATLSSGRQGVSATRPAQDINAMAASLAMAQRAMRAQLREAAALVDKLHLMEEQRAKTAAKVAKRRQAVEQQGRRAKLSGGA